MDIAHTEMVEKEFDAFIERRAQKGEQDEDEQDALWKASVKRYHERERRETAAAWCVYEWHLARLHAQLASEHEAKALSWAEMIEGMDKDEDPSSLEHEENGHLSGVEKAMP